MALRFAERGPGPIIEQLRKNAAAGARPMGLPEVAALVDALVHGLDIRRPLDASRVISPEAFTAAADWLVEQRWPTTIPAGGKVSKTVSGLHLVTDDVAWSHGAGPEVHGSSEAMLLLLTGRPVGATELTGSGSTEVYRRL
jgi:hypothetical protein